ncbi:protein of unknown function (plasmid) [Azospirillum baldaniorum]|uniref:Uncharacterized protein n=1 Tax=Azospirillum baldaniorum TaxID=1064539 RepID=A0A9P1K163_9PROT|nr:protein of unknown function [Azospirillum baldaniorum]
MENLPTKSVKMRDEFSAVYVPDRLPAPAYGKKVPVRRARDALLWRCRPDCQDKPR